MSRIDDLRKEYLQAVSELFNESTRDPAFQTDEEFRAAAMAAQSALGHVELWLYLDDSKLDPKLDPKLVANELHKAEAGFKTAVETLLGKTISMQYDEIASRAQRVAEIKRKFDSATTPRIK